MSVTLSIVFTGLCALVADGDRGPGQVLLVDARGVGEVGGVLLPPHAPTLVVRLRDLANAEASQPNRVVVAGGVGPSAPTGTDLVGLWDLTGTEVRVRVQGREGTGLELFRPPLGTSAWPDPPHDVDDPPSWRDIRFVASLEALLGDGRIRPELVASDSGPPGLPREVASRFHLDAGRIEAVPPSEDAHRDDVYEFRTRSGEVTHRQAMTDGMRWTLEAETSAVVVEIVSLAGEPTRRLVLGPSAVAHRLFVSNLPSESDPHHAHETASAGALHFGAYYKLLRHPPSDPPMPSLWVPPAARSGAGFGRPAFCGSAAFRR